jgi:type VI secretion system secreted protein VgrG
MVKKALGLFVHKHKEGAKSGANQTSIKIQTQHDTTPLFSDKQLTVTNSESKIMIRTPEALALYSDGSYLRLSKNGIEFGTMKTAE